MHTLRPSCSVQPGCVLGYSELFNWFRSKEMNRGCLCTTDYLRDIPAATAEVVDVAIEARKALKHNGGNDCYSVCSSWVLLYVISVYGKKCV
ncbi:hypothetical protein L1987_12927 [Smallanthus sonchifolius]|uniref:Uncharacterized protein n=1 Tax=Smallanthus sonchifolius TaxID=185202 RepID=A0ACB9JFJ5_9ASTR|nr:hypothetical protein L1987_12927 [Smallanthus sonchifolius]